MKKIGLTSWIVAGVLGVLSVGAFAGNAFATNTNTGVAPVIVAANTPTPVGGSADPVQDGLTKVSDKVGTTKSLEDIVGTVISTMLFIVGILAVIMIIYAGIRYTTAHGDKGQIESAKSTLIYAVVGLVVAIVAYALVQFVVTTLKK